MAEIDRTDIELRLTTAATYLQQNKPDDAQRLLIAARRGAEELQLEDLVNAAKRSLAVSHLSQANLLHGSGNLEGAAAKYSDAEHAYTEFTPAFEGQENTLADHWGMLYTPWVSATCLLAQKAHVEGNNRISSASSANNVAKAVLSGLKSWDVALQWYSLTLEIHERAKGRGVNLNEAFRTLPEQAMKDIRTAGARFANSVGRPDVAEKYLPRL